MQRQILSKLVLLVRARGKITHKLFTTKVLPTGYTAWLGKLVEFWPIGKTRIRAIMSDKSVSKKHAKRPNGQRNSKFEENSPTVELTKCVQKPTTATPQTIMAGGCCR